jgi:HD-GYP domain-containing protein (c-di-GMP phosphodiesterase class II)
MKATNLYRVVILTSLLLLGWSIVYMTRGVNVTFHLFYFPIILAGRFWRLPGGICAGLIAGLVAGPLLPVGEVPQTLLQWCTRLVIFILVGACVGHLIDSLHRRKEEIKLQKQNLETNNNQILEQQTKILQQKKKIQKQMVDLVNHQEKIQQFSAGIIEALAFSIEVRDSYTSGHCRRVSDMSVKIGERLQMSHQELSYLKWSGMLHDIGKIGIHEEILAKVGKLTPNEFDIMKQHPTLGLKILGGIPLAEHILDGVLHHHERMDGKGYPFGLKGEEIGLQARIIAVCDVWDALTSKRAYRDAMPQQLAMDIMESGRGSQFDPVILDHFLAVVGKQASKTEVQADETIKETNHSAAAVFH